MTTSCGATSARDEDLYVTYAIVPPQSGRSQPAHRQPEPFLHPGVVAEREGGIVVHRAQAIATSAVLAGWLFLSYITPLVPGDEDYALAFIVPIAAEGLRLYPRRPFAGIATSVYDYPLSSRFDEVDATVVIHDVFAPWEQVFIYRNVDLVDAQFHESPSHRARPRQQRKPRRSRCRSQPRGVRRGPAAPR